MDFSPLVARRNFKSALQQRARPWGDQGTIAHALNAIAHRGIVGKGTRNVGPHRPSCGRGRATRLSTASNVGAFRLAPHAGDEWRSADPVGECGWPRRECPARRVEAARGPQRCALATASNEETTTWISHCWWRGGISSGGDIRGQGRVAIVGPLPTLYTPSLTVGEWGRV